VDDLFHEFFLEILIYQFVSSEHMLQIKTRVQGREMPQLRKQKKDEKEKEYGPRL
jgi:hypothetical protein